MWVRNIVCSVVTLGLLWAFAHYWRELGTKLTAGGSFSGLGIFATITCVFLSIIYLIARAADVRAGRLPALREKLRRPTSPPARSGRTRLR